MVCNIITGGGNLAFPKILTTVQWFVRVFWNREVRQLQEKEETFRCSHSNIMRFKFMLQGDKPTRNSSPLSVLTDYLLEVECLHKKLDIVSS